MASLKYTPEEREYLRAKGARFDDVIPENIHFWNAYMSLRLAANENGHIPASEISAYCDLIDVADVVQKNRLARVVGALSKIEVKYVSSEIKT